MNYALQAFGLYKETETASALKMRDYKDATDLIAGGGGIDLSKSVRRLMPIECERLQGMPDNWTNLGDWIDENGKKHKEADSPRYKALGNGVALPFWEWLLGRISAQYDRPATLGSLFDGIGSFPLAWSKFNGKENCIWCSEIEQFPIAVSKKHFPEGEEIITT